MGWYAHPDTLSVAAAQGVANKTGFPEGSLEWMRAYRNAYFEHGDGGTGADSFREYIEMLDEQIRKLEPRP